MKDYDQYDQGEHTRFAGAISTVAEMVMVTVAASVTVQFFHA